MAKKQELKLNKIGCTNCGAEVLFDPGTQVLNCNFCGSTFEVEEAVEEKVITPDGILPFSIKKEMFRNLYRESNEIYRKSSETC